MFKNLLDKGKCKIGLHAGEWTYDAVGACDQTRLCERCATESKRVEHTWEEWAYVSEDACAMTRGCERCGEVESRVVHEWGEWVYSRRDACEQVQVCERCGETGERTKVIHEWTAWEFSPRHAGPVRVCARCGELAGPGASGSKPSDEELGLILKGLLAADSEAEIGRIMQANEAALFSNRADSYLQQERRRSPAIAEHIEGLRRLIEASQSVGIDAAMRQVLGGTATTGAPTATPTARPSAASQPRPTPPRANIDPQLVGTWKNSYFEGGSSAILYTYYVDLKRDGTFTESENTVYAGSTVGSTGMRETNRGQWDLQRGLLALRYDNGRQVACRYQIRGQTLACQFTDGSYQEWERV